MLLPVDLRDPNAVETADELYRGIVDQAAAQPGEPKTINNKDPRHAAYLLETFFRGAEDHVRIYTTQLARKVGREPVYASPDLIEAAKALLDKPASQISIIVQDDLDLDKGMAAEDHPLIAGLLAAGSFHGRGTPSRSPAEGSRLHVYKHEGDRELGDFAVMDESAYRAEIDEQKATAIANFGNPELASRLAQLFDWMTRSEQCKPIPIHESSGPKGESG